MNKNKLPENIFLGVILMIASQFFSASVVTAVKVVSVHVPTLVIVFISYFICLCLITLIIFFKKDFKIRTHNLLLQLARSCTGVLYFGGLFWAVKYIPVVDGILLRTTAPIWVPFIAFIWLKEKINHKIWWGITIGFIGIIFVLHPTLVGINMGYFIALLAGISYAISSVITYKLNALKEPLFRTLFYAFLLPSILLAPYAFSHWPKELNIEDILLIIFIGIGTFSLLMFYVSALRYASATVLLPITYFGVIIAGYYDWLFWNDIPNFLSVIGILLVLLGCFIIVWVKNREVSIQKNKIFNMTN